MKTEGREICKFRLTVLKSIGKSIGIGITDYFQKYGWQPDMRQMSLETWWLIAIKTFI